MSPIMMASKILIVEDEAALAEIYKTRLEILGYECYVAYDGIEALDMIYKHRPNLVLLDIMLPKISGDVILQTLRSVTWGKNIRVFVISNLNESDAPPGLREHGIEGYAVKANMADGEIDLLVNNILKPDGQNTNFVLSHDKPSSQYDQKDDRNPTVQDPPPPEPNA
jgi:DNA-binding response OmpR family regulator